MYNSYWELLKIEPTTDKKTIQKAYSNQLPNYHPEDDPEGFARLKEAYQAAIAYAKQQPTVISVQEDLYVHSEIEEPIQPESHTLYEQLEQTIGYDVDYLYEQWKLLCEEQEEDQNLWQHFLNKKYWKPFTITIDMIQKLFAYEYAKSYNHSALIAGKIYMFLNLKEFSDDEITQRFQILLKQDAHMGEGFLTWKDKITQFSTAAEAYSKHNYAKEEWESIIQRSLCDATFLELRYVLQEIVANNTYSEPVWTLLENTFQVQSTNSSFLPYRPKPVCDNVHRLRKRKTYSYYIVLFILFIGMMFVISLSKSAKEEQLEKDREMIENIQQYNQDYIEEQNDKMKDFLKQTLEDTEERTE